MPSRMRFQRDLRGADIKPADLFPERNGHTSKPQIVATYPYRDEQGELLFQVVRFAPKDFRQRRTGSFRARWLGMVHKGCAKGSVSPS